MTILPDSAKRKMMQRRGMIYDGSSRPGSIRFFLPQSARFTRMKQNGISAAILQVLPQSHTQESLLPIPVRGRKLRGQFRPDAADG